MFNNHVRLILSKMVIWHRCPYLYMCIQFTTLKKLFYQYIVIHDIDPIRYHRDVIYTIEFTDERFIISMGLNPELL